jgi:hypothetical protein
MKNRKNSTKAIEAGRKLVMEAAAKIRTPNRLQSVRIGEGPHDSCSANGWYVMNGDLAVAGPYCDKGVSDRHLNEIAGKACK